MFHGFWSDGDPCQENVVQKFCFSSKFWISKILSIPEKTGAGKWWRSVYLTKMRKAWIWDQNLPENMKWKFGKLLKPRNRKPKTKKPRNLLYFQARESPAPLNIPTPTLAPDQDGPACLSGPVACPRNIINGIIRLLNCIICSLKALFCELPALFAN